MLIQCRNELKDICMCVCVCVWRTSCLRKALSAMQRSTVSGSWRTDTISRMSVSLARTSTARAPWWHTCSLFITGTLHTSREFTWTDFRIISPPVQQHTCSLQGPESTNREINCKMREITLQDFTMWIWSYTVHGWCGYPSPSSWGLQQPGWWRQSRPSHPASSAVCSSSHAEDDSSGKTQTSDLTKWSSNLKNSLIIF